MKKLLSIICVAILAVTVSSCKKETVVAPASQNFTATVSNWKTDDNGVTYYASVPVSAIDSYYDKQGAVLVYNYLSDIGEYEQLPSVFSGISFSYTYGDGGVTIYAQNANGGGVTPVPDNLQLKIVLLD